MGYYTYYRLSIIKGTKTEKQNLALIAEFRAESEDARHALTEEGYSDNASKWYSRVNELIKFSMKYPKVVFELYGEGENPTDIWCEYYKNGKLQREVARITIDNFDPKKLK